MPQIGGNSIKKYIHCKVKNILGKRNLSFKGHRNVNVLKAKKKKFLTDNFTLQRSVPLLNIILKYNIHLVNIKFIVVIVLVA